MARAGAGVRRRQSTDKPKTILDVGPFKAPGRLAIPLVVFVVVTLMLVAFGCVMIYSASSVTALSSADTNYDAAYYVNRQLVFAVGGLVAAVVLAKVNYHFWLRNALYVLWFATLFLLLLVMTPIAGQDAYGATRWLAVGGFTVQPSEFAKLTVVLTAANVFERHYHEGELDGRHFALALGLGVVVPMLLILVQPDKGTTIIIALTLYVMLALAGEERGVLALLLLAGVAGVVFLTLKDDYSRRRLAVMLDPFQDYYGDGWQLAQGYYAFGSGGLFGVGLGMSKQKYSYLPFAYNDFIFAVVGEELGLVGALGMLAAFGALVWAGYRIARYAPDMSGRLIAAGLTSLIWIQLAVNVCGVLGIIPLSGKPVPFVSYGGSSILSCLMMAGLVTSVSLHTGLPETEHEARRRRLTVAANDRVDPGLSSAGEVHRRSERRAAPLTLVQGGAAPAARAEAAVRAGGRRDATAPRRERVNLGPSAAERLRPDTRARRSRRDEGSGHGA